MKKSSVMSLICASAILVSSTSAFALTPWQYDGQSYESLGLTSTDPDGEINLAVIANGNVTLGNSMYIEGSVYTTGDIRTIDGEGNTINGLFISGTGDHTYGSANNGDTTTYTAVGYKIVDADGNEITTTAHDSKPNYNGAINDTDTSFECTYTDFSVPEIANKVMEKTSVSKWTPVTISDDIYYEELELNYDGLIIDATNNAVTVVINQLDRTSSDPYFTVLGDNKVNIYVNKISQYGSETNLLKIFTQKAVGHIDAKWQLWNVPSYDRMGEMKDMIEELGSEDQITFYVGASSSSDTIEIQGSRAYANIVSNKNLTMGYSSYIIGDVECGGNFRMSSSNALWGVVCAPNSNTFIGEGATLYGQLHTKTLDTAGAGSIIYKADSINTTPAATDAPSSSSIYLNIIEDVIYILPGGTAAITIDHNTKYDWDWSAVSEPWKFNGVTKGNSGATDNAYWDGEVFTDTSWATTPQQTSAGNEFVLKAVSKEDSSVYDTVKIIVVNELPATSAPTAVPTEAPTEEPTAAPTKAPATSGEEEIFAGSSKYAYIFGDEPIYNVEEDENGEVINCSAEVNMQPDREVARQEACAMIMRLVDQCKGGINAGRKDIPTSIVVDYADWAEKGMGYLSQKGAYDDISYTVSGYSYPTRGEVAKLVVKGLGLTLKEGAMKFTDIAGTEFEQYINIMTSNGYMQGDGNGEFRPEVSMTRAEFCAMFNNITGRTNYELVDAEGNPVTPETYYIVDLDGAASWKVRAMMLGTSAFTVEKKVDVATRIANIRNKLDSFEAQKEY